MLRPLKWAKHILRASSRTSVVIAVGVLDLLCFSLSSRPQDDLRKEDFSSMSAQLLYKMIKSKTEYPLHKAIKVEREDVVFLYLIEMDSQVLSLLSPQTVHCLFFSDMPLTPSAPSLAQPLMYTHLPVVCSGQCSFFCYAPQNPSSLCPLTVSKATSTCLGRCWSSTRLPGTKICSGVLLLLQEVATNLVAKNTDAFSQCCR